MIRILHLYYDLMNLYGEYGNLVVLCDNLTKNKIDYKLDRLSIGDDIDFSNYDFIYCGSGTENKTDLAFNDFIQRKDSFIKALESGKYILFTGSSLTLLGRTYNKKKALSIFNFDSSKGDKRISGDVIVKSEEYQYIVGFINTSYIVEGYENEYFTIIGSDNIIKKYHGVGYKKNNLLAVNMTGPLLVKNPLILKNYIEGLGTTYNKDFQYIDCIKENQYKSFDVTLNELKKRFNTK